MVDGRFHCFFLFKHSYFQLLRTHAQHFLVVGHHHHRSPSANRGHGCVSMAAPVVHCTESDETEPLSTVHPWMRWVHPTRSRTAHGQTRADTTPVAVDHPKDVVLRGQRGLRSAFVQTKWTPNTGHNPDTTTGYMQVGLRTNVMAASGERWDSFP